MTWYADNHPYQIQANGATETFRYSPDGNRYLRVDTTPQAAWFMTDRRSDLQLRNGHRHVGFNPQLRRIKRLQMPICEILTQPDSSVMTYFTSQKKDQNLLTGFDQWEYFQM